jgi:aerobic-type carbon monoxide dehydrogenase small subunit (CoxS/CutS family)
MQFTINGQPQTVDCDLRTSLLDLLRDHLGLTGTKKGCDQGACGAKRGVPSACTPDVRGRGDRIQLR